MKWPTALSASPSAAPHEEGAVLRLDAAGRQLLEEAMGIEEIRGDDPDHFRIAWFF